MLQEEYERELRVLVEKTSTPVRSLVGSITNDLTVTWFSLKWKILEILGYDVQVIHACEYGCGRVSPAHFRQSPAPLSPSVFMWFSLC